MVSLLFCVLICTTCKGLVVASATNVMASAASVKNHSQSLGVLMPEDYQIYNISNIINDIKSW